MLAVANALPSALKVAASNNDDFWAEKPIHTTDLMAGTARTTAQPSTSRTQSPTAAPGMQVSDKETNEL